MIRLAKVLNIFLTSVVIIVVLGTVFLWGFRTGSTSTEFQANMPKPVETSGIVASPKPTSKIIYVTPKPQTKPSWGGPQLWDAVNKRRVEFGVNPLSVKEEVCTISSIRLNQLLELGKLDGHAGFSKMPDERPDLKWIFDKYNLSEFLVSGATSPQDAVNLWENTLGHKELLSGGQYVWGCIYAQNGFGVAITAY